MTPIQQSFHKFYHGVTQKYRLSPQQHKVARHIGDCRTAALGGNISICQECAGVSIHYNSCRDRHCPQCQGINKAVWVDSMLGDVLNAPYFHVVVTMPRQLHPLIYSNQELLYSLMYKATAESLTELANDPKYLGAQIGFISILHTWGQNLHYHPHIHTLVLAGGLTPLNTWKQSSNKFFIPVKVLSKKVRGKFLCYLKRYYYEKQLEFHGDAKPYKNAMNFKDLMDECYKTDWYSYTRETFSCPSAVVNYIGRYTHRIAISNNRIISVDEEAVTIAVKDYKDDNKQKAVTMQGIEFIRRFLLHVLPKGFRKVRHYGILATRNKKTKLRLCRKLTGSKQYKPKYKGLKTLEILKILMGRDTTLCLYCKSKQIIVKEIAKEATSP
jgi:hypothetical protein